MGIVLGIDFNSNAVIIYGGKTQADMTNHLFYETLDVLLKNFGHSKNSATNDDIIVRTILTYAISEGIKAAKSRYRREDVVAMYFAFRGEADRTNLVNTVTYANANLDKILENISLKYKGYKDTAKDDLYRAFNTIPIDYIDYKIAFATKISHTIDEKIRMENKFKSYLPDSSVKIMLIDCGNDKIRFNQMTYLKREDNEESGGKNEIRGRAGAEKSKARGNYGILQRGEIPCVNKVIDLDKLFEKTVETYCKIGCRECYVMLVGWDAKNEAVRNRVERAINSIVAEKGKKYILDLYGNEKLEQLVAMGTFLHGWQKLENQPKYEFKCNVYSAQIKSLQRRILPFEHESNKTREVFILPRLRNVDDERVYIKVENTTENTAENIDITDKLYEKINGNVCHLRCGNNGGEFIESEIAAYISGNTSGIRLTFKGHKLEIPLVTAKNN